MRSLLVLAKFPHEGGPSRPGPARSSTKERPSLEHLLLFWSYSAGRHLILRLLHTQTPKMVRFFSLVARAGQLMLIAERAQE